MAGQYLFIICSKQKVKDSCSNGTLLTVPRWVKIFVTAQLWEKKSSVWKDWKAHAAV